MGLTKRGIRVEFKKESLTFTGEDSPMPTLLLSMLGAVSEFERALIKERQREGIAIAKRKRCTVAESVCYPRNRLGNCASVLLPAKRKQSLRVTLASAAKRVPVLTGVAARTMSPTVV
jgi:DNA invertase Pin-like site-specific DNA recombinase